jgi:hypothetical protein
MEQPKPLRSLYSIHPWATVPLRSLVQRFVGLVCRSCPRPPGSAHPLACLSGSFVGRRLSSSGSIRQCAVVNQARIVVCALLPAEIDGVNFAGYVLPNLPLQKVANLASYRLGRGAIRIIFPASPLSPVEESFIAAAILIPTKSFAARSGSADKWAYRAVVAACL